MSAVAIAPSGAFGRFFDRRIDWVAKQGVALNERFAGNGWLARRARGISASKVGRLFGRVLLSDTEVVKSQSDGEVVVPGPRHDERFELVDIDTSKLLTRYSLGLCALCALPVPTPPLT